MACIPPTNFFKAPIGAFLGVLQSAVACDSTRNLFLHKKSFDSSHELRWRKTSPTCHVVTLAPRLHPAPPRLQESSGSTAKWFRQKAAAKGFGPREDAWGKLEIGTKSCLFFFQEIKVKKTFLDEKRRCVFPTGDVSLLVLNSAKTVKSRNGIIEVVCKKMAFFPNGPNGTKCCSREIQRHLCPTDAMLRFWVIHQDENRWSFRSNSPVIFFRLVKASPWTRRFGDFLGFRTSDNLPT